MTPFLPSRGWGLNFPKPLGKSTSWLGYTHRRVRNIYLHTPEGSTCHSCCSNSAVSRAPTRRMRGAGVLSRVPDARLPTHGNPAPRTEIPLRPGGPGDAGCTPYPPTPLPPRAHSPRCFASLWSSTHLSRREKGPRLLAPAQQSRFPPARGALGARERPLARSPFTLAL